MLYKRGFHVFVAVFCMYLTSKSAAVPAIGVLQSNLLGGHQYSSNLDCQKYSNDLDVLAELPFEVKLNPPSEEFHNGQKSVAAMSADGTFVERLALKNEKVVPQSLFCLSNVTILQIESTPFENDVIPDAFTNLQALKYFIVHFVPIKAITEQFGKLVNLEGVTFMGCSLTHLPKSMNQLHQLKILNLPHNSLTGIDEFAQSSLEVLDLTANNITEVPVLKNRENLMFLLLSFNQLKNVEPMVLYTNLQYIFLDHAALTSLPASIDKLQELQQLLINDNQLTDLPRGIYELPKLQYLAADRNQFSSESVESIKKAFEQYQPTAFLSI